MCFCNAKFYVGRSKRFKAPKKTNGNRVRGGGMNEKEKRASVDVDVTNSSCRLRWMLLWNRPSFPENQFGYFWA